MRPTRWIESRRRRAWKHYRAISLMRLSKLENLGRSFQVNRISVQCLAKLHVLVKNPINRVAVAKEDQNRVCIRVHHTSWRKRPKVKGNVVPREMLATADENGALGQNNFRKEKSANLFAVSSCDWKYVIKMLVSFSFKRVPPSVPPLLSRSRAFHPRRLLRSPTSVFPVFNEVLLLFNRNGKWSSAKGDGKYDKLSTSQMSRVLFQQTKWRINVATLNRSGADWD